STLLALIRAQVRQHDVRRLHAGGDAAVDAPLGAQAVAVAGPGGAVLGLLVDDLVAVLEDPVHVAAGPDLHGQVGGQPLVVELGDVEGGDAAAADPEEHLHLVARAEGDGDDGGAAGPAVLVQVLHLPDVREAAGPLQRRRDEDVPGEAPGVAVVLLDLLAGAIDHPAGLAAEAVVAHGAGLGHAVVVDGVRRIVVRVDAVG